MALLREAEGGIAPGAVVSPVTFALRATTPAATPAPPPRGSSNCPPLTYHAGRGSREGRYLHVPRGSKAAPAGWVTLYTCLPLPSSFQAGGWAGAAEEVPLLKYSGEFPQRYLPADPPAWGSGGLCAEDPASLPPNVLGSCSPVFIP